MTVTATVGDGSNGVDNGKVKLAAVFAASDSSDVSSATYAWDYSINETTAEVTIEAPQAETTYKCTVTFDGETYEGSATVTP